MNIATIFEEKEEEKFSLILQCNMLNEHIRFALSKNYIQNNEEKCDLSQAQNLLLENLDEEDLSEEAIEVNLKRKE